MNRLRVLAVALLALLPTSGDAFELTWKSYNNPENANFKRLNSLWIDGLKSGFVMSNAALRNEGKPMLFCAPPKLALTVEQAEDILQRASKKVRTISDDMPVSVILLDGLQETFPCPK